MLWHTAADHDWNRQRHIGCHWKQRNRRRRKKQRCSGWISSFKTATVIDFLPGIDPTTACLWCTIGWSPVNLPLLQNKVLFSRILRLFFISILHFPNIYCSRVAVYRLIDLFEIKLIHRHYSFIHSGHFYSALQVLYYSEALPTTARTLYRSFTPKRTGNCRYRTCPRSLHDG